MGALVFPSEAWVADWTRRCNDSAAYLAQAAGWDGSVALEIRPDADPSGPRVLVRLTALDGRWTSHLVGADPALAERVSFLLTATRATWEQLVRQELDPVRAIVRGTVRVEGRLTELFAWSGSLRAMTELAGQVDTVFGDGTGRG